MKKHLTRKEFMKLSAMTAMALPLTNLTGCAPKKEADTSSGAASTPAETVVKYADHPGIQVYTVREQYEKDPRGTLQKLAEIGYKELEFYAPNTLAEYAPVARELGLEVVSTHFLPGFVTNDWEVEKQMGMKPPENYSLENIIEDCAKSDVHYMGISIIFPKKDQTLDDFKRFAEAANKAGALSKASGVQLYYHNHSLEFKPTDGTTPYEEMLKIFDPELVKLEMDVFWVSISGNDPAAWIERLKGRVKMLHLKDVKEGTPTDYTTFQAPHDAFMPVGDGTVDFKKVLEAAHAADVPYTFVEQDHSQGDIFESITRSYNHLKELGL